MLTGNITIAAASTNYTVRGQRLRFIFTQDATGSRTVTWNAQYLTTWQPSTTASSVSVIEFVCDGTNWIQTSSTGDAAGGVTLEEVRDDLASVLTAGSNVTITPNDAANTITIASTGTGAIGDIGVLRLDDFAGADDDAKLAAALSQIGGETFKRPVALWDNRVYTFTDPVDLFNGFALIGPPRHGNQPVTTPRYPHEVMIDCGTQPFLRVPASGSVFNVHVSNLSFEAVGSTEVWMGYDSGGAAGGVLWTANIRDVGFSLFKSVLGTPSDKLLLTACTFNGFWNINNSYDVAITIGGSDNNLWTDGCLLDSDTAFTFTGNVPYHLHCDYLEKTNIGPMYITAEANPATVRIDGNDSTGGLIFTGTRMEGRNAGLPPMAPLSTSTAARPGTIRDCLFWFGGCTLPQRTHSPTATARRAFYDLGGCARWTRVGTPVPAPMVLLKRCRGCTPPASSMRFGFRQCRGDQRWRFVHGLPMYASGVVGDDRLRRHDDPHRNEQYAHPPPPSPGRAIHPPTARSSTTCRPACGKR